MLADAEARLARLDPEEQALERDLWTRRGVAVATCRRQPDGSWRLVAEEGFLRPSGILLYDFDEPADEPEEAADARGAEGADGSEGPGGKPGEGAGGAP